MVRGVRNEQRQKRADPGGAGLMSKIAELNDQFRRTLTGGRALMTVGVNALPADTIARALAMVREFNTFTADNDPHKEHDFGNFEIAGQRFFWKIDYYDKSMEFGSEDPANPDITTRVLTIMLAEEY
jgi:hypothetical protein